MLVSALELRPSGLDLLVALGLVTARCCFPLIKAPWVGYRPHWFRLDGIGLVTILASQFAMPSRALQCPDRSDRLGDAPIDWGTLAADMVGAGTITWASVALATHWDDKVGGRPDVNFCYSSHAHDHRSNLPLQSSTLPV